MRTSTILAFGAFGGCCPTIARLASFYSTNPGSDMPQLGVYLAMGLFAILGAFIAVGFGADEVKAAIVAGIAAPGLVTNIVAGANSGGPGTPGADVVALSLFAAPAFAQQVETESALTNTTRTITLTPTFTGPAPTQNQVEYRFVTDTGTFLPGGGVLVPEEDGVAVPVPEGATNLAIGATITPLPDDSTAAQITIQTAPSLGGDLVWALGGQRRYDVTGVDVTYGDGAVPTQ